MYVVVLPNVTPVDQETIPFGIRGGTPQYIAEAKQKQRCARISV